MSQVTQLKLRPFDPSRIKRDRVCVVIGKRGTGKTTLVTTLLSHVRDIPCGVCFSGTEESNAYYQRFIPSTFIHGSFDLPTFKRYVETQRRVSAQHRTGEFSGDPGSFLLLDDCMYDKGLTKYKEVRELFMNGRHWKILVMLTMQYCMDMPPDLRANVDYVFILRENILSNRERLWKYFYGMFPTFAGFCTAMDVCTADYGAMVLDNTVNSNRIEDCVFHFKASTGLRFKMGSRQFWKFHREVFDAERDDTQEEQLESGNPKKQEFRVSRVNFSG